MDIQTRREREKQLVFQMIALYCKNNTEASSFAPTAPLRIETNREKKRLEKTT